MIQTSKSTEDNILPNKKRSGQASPYRPRHLQKHLQRPLRSLSRPTLPLRPLLTSKLDQYRRVLLLISLISLNPSSKISNQWHSPPTRSNSSSSKESHLALSMLNSRMRHRQQGTIRSCKHPLDRDRKHHLSNHNSCSLTSQVPALEATLLNHSRHNRPMHSNFLPHQRRYLKMGFLISRANRKSNHLYSRYILNKRIHSGNLRYL